MSACTFPPVLVLEQMRAEVLARSIQRTPKWGFRVAPDLILQLQPKPAQWTDPHVVARAHRLGFAHARQEAVRFDGRALLVIEGPSPKTFARPPAGTRWMDTKIAVVGYAATPERWELQARASRWAQEIGDGWADVKRTLLDRLHASFRDGQFDHLTPDLMLQPACLVCGKRLTDPVSMARWIGPECFGSTSVTVPRLLRLEATP